MYVTNNNVIDVNTNIVYR